MESSRSKSIKSSKRLMKLNKKRRDNLKKSSKLQNKSSSKKNSTFVRKTKSKTRWTEKLTYFVQIMLRKLMHSSKSMNRQLTRKMKKLRISELIVIKFCWRKMKKLNRWKKNLTTRLSKLIIWEKNSILNLKRKAKNLNN